MRSCAVSVCSKQKTFETTLKRIQGKRSVSQKWRKTVPCRMAYNLNNDNESYNVTTTRQRPTAIEFNILVWFVCFIRLMPLYGIRRPTVTRSTATAEKQRVSCACLPRLGNGSCNAQNTAVSQRLYYILTF